MGGIPAGASVFREYARGEEGGGQGVEGRGLRKVAPAQNRPPAAPAARGGAAVSGLALRTAAVRAASWAAAREC